MAYSRSGDLLVCAAAAYDRGDVEDATMLTRCAFSDPSFHSLIRGIDSSNEKAAASAFETVEVHSATLSLGADVEIRESALSRKLRRIQKRREAGNEVGG